MSEPTQGTTRHHAPTTAAAVVGIVQKLPPLPGSIHELLALNLKDKDLPEKVQAVVARDPALAAHVIRVANSAAFRGQAPITALGPAIHRVGAPLVVANALESAVHSIFDPYGGMGRKLGQVAVLEANVMAALAASWEAHLHIPSEVAYTHGLLHDVGHLVMALKLGKALESFGHRCIPAAEVAQREAETFGFDHQQAGRILGNHWKLPEDITVVIASHHFPRELRQGQQDSTNALIDLLAVTDRLSRIILQNPEHRTQVEAAMAEWLVTPEARKLLQPLGAAPDEVLNAIPSAFSGLERDQRMSANADTPNPP